MSATTDLVMPKLGLTMAEGLLAEWRVGPGAKVRAGEVLFVVETEKIASEIAAPADGEVTEILVAAGETVAVGTTLARWTGPGLAVDGMPSAMAATVPAATDMTPSASTAPTARRTGRIVATPYARRLARERGIDLNNIAGSGPGGRIKAADIEAARSTTVEAPLAPVTQAQIATEADIGRAETMREGLNRYLGERRIDLVHFVVAGLARALAATDTDILYGEARLTHAATMPLGRLAAAMADGGDMATGNGPAIAVFGPAPVTYLAPTVPSG